MSTITNDISSTAVSNIFIDEYLSEANDAQIKVYLYLLRMTQSCRATSISDIADKFNHTEKDVCRALKFWEKKGLLALAYDAMGSIIGIQVYSNVVSPIQPAMAGTFTPVSMATGPMFATGPILPVSSLESNYFSYPGVQPAMPYAEASAKDQAPAKAAMHEKPKSFVKPNYTADDLDRFSREAANSELIFVAEQYLKRTLKPADIQSLLFISDTLGFSKDLTDHLLQYCVGKGKTSFNYIEAVAIAWAEKGIVTPKDAEQESDSYDSNVYSVMKALGKNAAPTQIEVSFIRKWRNEFGFSTDIILEACNRTVLATDKGRFQYANKILETWKKAGVQTCEDIKTQDKLHKPVTDINSHKSSSANTSFHHFEQKDDYDFNAIENMLLKKQQ